VICWGEWNRVKHNIFVHYNNTVYFSGREGLKISSLYWSTECLFIEKGLIVVFIYTSVNK
jgi:hypothetical protein